jgi:hypothetical protein
MKENQKEMLKIQREMKEGIEIISKRTSKRFGVSEVIILFLFLSLISNFKQFLLRNLLKKTKEN